MKFGKQKDHQCLSKCSGCGELFVTTAQFDRHRVGPYGAGRRCLTTDELADKGWSRNARGAWRSPLTDAQKASMDKWLSSVRQASTD